jgi:hypothetical protein
MSHVHNLREKIDYNPSKPVYIQTVSLRKYELSIGVCLEDKQKYNRVLERC